MPPSKIQLHELQLLACRPHRGDLVGWADGATRVQMFVSFLFPEGVAFVRDVLEHARVDLTVSTYLRATRKRALEDLAGLLEHPTPGTKGLRVRVATGDRDGFHGKFYRYDYGDATARVVVGSANLSRSGLGGSGEVSLMAAGPEASMPSLRGKDIPALRDRTWASSADSTPLTKVIASYTESAFGAKFGDAFTSDVYSFVDVTLASDAEKAAAAEAIAAPPGDFGGTADGDVEEGDLPLVIQAKYHKAWAQMSEQIQLGEVVLLGWKGEGSLKAYRLAGRRNGVVPPLRAERTFLYLRPIPSSKLARDDIGWKNRVVPREDLPGKLLARIDAAPLVPIAEKA